MSAPVDAAVEEPEEPDGRRWALRRLTEIMGDPDPQDSTPIGHRVLAQYRAAVHGDRPATEHLDEAPEKPRNRGGATPCTKP